MGGAKDRLFQKCCERIEVVDDPVSSNAPDDDSDEKIESTDSLEQKKSLSNVLRDDESLRRAIEIKNMLK